MANLIAKRSDDRLPLKPTAKTRSQPDEGAKLERSNWLSFHRVWGQLSDRAIQAIAQSLQTLKVEPNGEIYRQGLKPVGLYLLKWGSVEIYRLSLVGKTHIIPFFRSFGILSIDVET